MSNGHSNPEPSRGNTSSDGSSALLYRSLHSQPPPQIVASEGMWLSLSDGRRILDATGGASVACLGYGDTRVLEAMNRQMSEVTYCHTLFFATGSSERLARQLVDSTDGQMARAFVVSSGSEAMEAAMKLARQYFLELPKPEPKRTRFIARKTSYHGNTLGALSMSGHKARRALFEPILMNCISHVSPAYAYRGQAAEETTERYVERLAEELDQEFQRVGPENVCAFVAEPIVGAALGCVPSPPGYFKALKDVCDKYGTLLILDEVMCGMGRSGTLHAWQHPDVGVVPDIQTMGKGLGGGYQPIAGMMINKKVFDVLNGGSGAFAHGQTYQGHPVACAASFAVQCIIKEDNLLENVRNMGELLCELLHKKLDTHPHVGDIRGRGLFYGIEFVKDKVTKEPFPVAANIAGLVHTEGLAAYDDWGITLYPSTGTADGVNGDHVIVSPAYNSTAADIEMILDAVTLVVHRVFAQLGGSKWLD